MNERLKELAEQAKEYARGFNYQHEVFEKKFAELIVEECASICYNSGMQDSDAHAQILLYEFNIHNCRNDK